MNAATRTVIERLVTLLENSEMCCDDLHHAKQDQHSYGAPCPVVARIKSAITEARKLLEGDALAQPADEGAWLTDKDLRRIAFDKLSGTGRSSLMKTEWKDGIDIDVLRTEAIQFLRAVIAEDRSLRTRPQQAGFVSVPVEPFAYGVLLADDTVDYSAPRPELCHEHINEFLMEDDLRENYIGARVIPLYTTAATKGDGK